MNNHLKGLLAGAFVFLIVLLLLSKCHSCRQEMEQQTADNTEQDVPENVEDIGGTGDLKIVLSWEFPGDIDIHVTQPNGNVINFMQKQDHSTGGELDVDNLNGGSPGHPAAENVFWPQPPAGDYSVMVNYYSIRDRHSNGGTVYVTVFNNGERTDYPVTLSYRGQEVQVTTIHYTPQ